MSRPTIALDSSYKPKEPTAANHLATTLPITPQRPTPNSAKKRRQMPDLTRPTATPSHRTKMSMIFRNASTSLQASRLPICQPSSNIKKSRLPVSHARSFKFGSTGQDDTVLLSDMRSPSEISQHLGEPYEPDSASSRVARHRAHGVRPHCSTPTSMTKAGHATAGTLTNQSLSTATGVGGLFPDETSRFGPASLSSRIENGKELISSGFATPFAPIPNSISTPEELKYPTLGNWPSLRSSSNASSLGPDDEELHPAHGVSFILPFPHSDPEAAPRSDINTWLSGVVEATTSRLSSSPKQSDGTEDMPINKLCFSRSIDSDTSSPIRPRVSPSKLKLDLQSPSGASSDKENLNPIKYCSSPISPTTQHHQAKSPSRFYQSPIQPNLQRPKALRFAHPLTPKGHLSIRPKRKRTRVDGIVSSSTEVETPITRRDFTVHEDQLSEALAQLSPDVERHRKGRGPKKERCMSYWDEDILQPGSQCVPMDVDGNEETVGKGKQVLRDSKLAVVLKTEQACGNDLGSANFQFEA